MSVEQRSVLSRFRWFLIVPIFLTLLAWIMILVLTEGQSIAPFVYSIR
jgi:hypothetical protein